MKINLVFNSFPTASETFLFNLSVELSKNGHEVTMILMEKSDNIKHYQHRLNEWNGKMVLTPRGSIIDLLSFFCINCVSFITFYRRFRFKNYKKLLSNFVKWRLFTSNEPEIIHFAYTGLAIEFGDVLDFVDSKTKVFVSARGSAEIVKPITDVSRVEELKRLWPKVHMVHCVSHHIRNTLQLYDLNSNKSFVNYPSIDLDKFSFTPKSFNSFILGQSEMIVLSTGRLFYQKGYVYALSAIKRLLDRGFPFRYRILGEGPDREYVEFIIKDNNLTSFVELVGKVNSSQVQFHLTESHVFLLPSIYEGVSNAVLEAMACGIPVVTTDAGGMPEVIKDQVNGLIVPRYDSLAIEGALLNVFSNYDSAIHRTYAARKTVEDNFSLQLQIKVFEENYRHALDFNSL